MVLEKIITVDGKAYTEVISDDPNRCANCAAAFETEKCLDLPPCYPENRIDGKFAYFVLAPVDTKPLVDSCGGCAGCNCQPVGSEVAVNHDLTSTV